MTDMQFILTKYPREWEEFCRCCKEEKERVKNKYVEKFESVKPGMFSDCVYRTLASNRLNELMPLDETSKNFFVWLGGREDFEDKTLSES